MSKGLGRVELAITTTFMKYPAHAFTVEELARAAYPRASSVEKKHRVAVIRAADVIAGSMGWKGFRTSKQPPQVIYANLLSPRSYTEGRERLGLSAKADDVTRHLSALRAARQKALDSEPNEAEG